jgi:hypothetical protein
MKLFEINECIRTGCLRSGRLGFVCRIFGILWHQMSGGDYHCVSLSQDQAKYDCGIRNTYDEI